MPTWNQTTKIGAYVVADKDNPSTNEQALLTELKTEYLVDLVDDDDVADAKMDFTAYSTIIVGSSSVVAKLGNLTDLVVPIVFTKGEHAATIGKMATVGAGNYGTSTGTQFQVTNNSHPTMLTEELGVYTLYTEDGDLNWLLLATLAGGVGVFANVKDEATHISIAILPLDGINSDGVASPEIRYFLGLPEVTKYTSHTIEHVDWIADWLVHQIALVTLVQSLTKSKIIEEMLGKGKFKKQTPLYDYLVHDTDGAPPYEVISEQEIGSVMERLEWIKNAVRRGTGTILPLNTSLYDYLLAIEGKLDVPADFMADVSALALEATLNTHDTDIKTLIAALNDISDADVWNYVTRTLTAHAFPFTNPGAALDVSNIRTAAYPLLTNVTYGLSALNTDLDTILTRVPAEVTQRAKSRFTVSRIYHIIGTEANKNRITVTSTAGNKQIRGGVSWFSIDFIPADVTIDSVYITVFAQVVENTNAAANKINGLQYIQVQERVAGTWTDCAKIEDDSFPIPATTRDMGRLLGEPVDCKSEVDGNDDYYLQWTNAQVDLDSMYFDDIFFIVEVTFH